MNDRLAAVSVLALSACAADPPTLPSAPLDPGTGTGSATATEDAGESTGAGTGTGGTPSTDGAGTSVDDSTGDAPPSCGNAVVEPDETCDDSNASEIDGCTTSCELGPVDVLPTGATNTDAVSFAAGLTPIDVDCPDGSVIVGADVSVSKVATGFEFHCAPLDLADSNPTSITMGPAELQPPAGFTGDGVIASVCPPGEMFGTVDFAVSGGYLTGMAVTCRALEVEGTGADQTLMPVEASSVAFEGGGTPNQQISCPAPMVAIGMRVAVDAADFPRGLGIRCRAMQLVYP